MAEEKEKSKGISLRKKSKSKRPVISAPRTHANEPLPKSQQGSASRSSNEQGSGSGRPRANGGGGKTSDLVKRRYSTRFTQIPKDFDSSLPPLPTVPTIPGQYSQRTGSAGRDAASATGQGLSVDTNVIRDPRLDADTYIADLLVNASSSEIDEYRSKLSKLRNRASTDLQQNVYQNRTQFIKISKEAEKLKGEMRSLRNLMSELRANTNVMGQAAAMNGIGSDSGYGTYDSMTAAARKQANRSSVAHLEAMWNTQLQSLWKNVEGSQKFLPAIPGRHVVRDSPHWVELNAATWKPRRVMHMFLLNDHLLVASRKKKRVEQTGSAPKQQSVPSKLVAERCFPLQEIQIVDLASAAPKDNRDVSQVADAINIRVGSESFTYRNDKADGSEKMGLLLSFRKTLEELKRSLKGGADSNGKVKDSLNYFAARDPSLLKQTELLETLSDSVSRDRPNIMIDVDGKQQNLRWVENQMDELDIEIALQRFETAVERVERMRKLAREIKSNVIAQELITFKVDERATRLAGLITRELVDTQSFLKATQKNAGWLSRLGFEDRAREAYLEARSAVIHKRTRQCNFQGDLQTYFFSVSYVVFTLIANTTTTFQACFPALMMSACVKWAREHVDDFNEILNRQLTGVPVDSEVYRKCLEISKAHAKAMSDVGLDFIGMIGREDPHLSKNVSVGEKPVGLGLG